MEVPLIRRMADGPDDKPPVPEVLRANAFPKGKSGNPGGRPRQKQIRAGIKHLKPAAFASLGKAVLGGERWATELWFHYWWGKPVDAIQLTGKDGEALSVSVVINRTLKAEDDDGSEG